MTTKSTPERIRDLRRQLFKQLIILLLTDSQMRRLAVLDNCRRLERQLRKLEKL